MIDKVNVDEDPTLANLGARYFARASLFLKRYRVDVEEGGSGLQIEGVHNETDLDDGAIAVSRWRWWNPFRFSTNMGFCRNA